MKRIKLIVAYDGSAYCGWQIQKNGVTVEQVLNETLTTLLGESIEVIGASRTDAGVHALGNVAVFDTKTKIPGDKIAYALNQRLPEDIRIQGSEEVESDFHPRYQNSTKTYEYRIYNAPFELPAYRQNTYFFHRPLSVTRMRQAAAYFEGEHDFAAFCSAHAQVRETTRTIYRVEVLEERPLLADEGQKIGAQNGSDNQLDVTEKDVSLDVADQFRKTGNGRLIRIRISGNGFLYNMVRIVAGTLIEVGLGKYPPEQVKRIIDSADRTQAGPCAPAKGLTLLGIVYEKTLADRLMVCNERMVYCLTQKEISSRQEASLCIWSCKEEKLSELLVRMTKKSFRLGAKHLYVTHMETPDLSKVLAPSRRNQCREKNFFTAGDFRFVFDHGDLQMDRDLRANPPQTEWISQWEEERKTTLGALTLDELAAFCALYNKCFYSQPCSLSMGETEAETRLFPKQEEQVAETDIQEPAAAAACGNERGFVVRDAGGALCAILLLSEAEWDEEACHIRALAVDGPCRRKGYGRYLIEQASVLAVREGKKRVTLTVSSRNAKAISLYESCGFYTIHREERLWYRVDRTKERKGS